MPSYRRLVLIALCLPLTSCELGPLGTIIQNIAMADDANYTIRDVVLVPPPGGSVGTFTVRWAYTQNGTQGAVAPVVALVDDDCCGLRGGPDVLVVQQKVASNPQYEELSLTLTCVNGDVTGLNEGSGEGTAEIFAMVEHLDGSGGVRSLDTFDVECP